MSTANHDRPPMVKGQCAEVLHLLRTLQPVPSFTLTAGYAIPETAARIHDLRAKGYNNVAMYSLGVPEWPAPGFLDEEVRA